MASNVAARTGLHVCRFVFNSIGLCKETAERRSSAACHCFLKVKPQNIEYLQLMGDVIGERRCFLSSGEIHTGDTIAVPEPVQTGLREVCVNKWVMSLCPLLTHDAERQGLTKHAAALGFFTNAPTAALLVLPRRSSRVSDGSRPIAAERICW